MFGNGNGSGIEEPQSTRSMWGDMFGLGPLMRLFSDPTIMNQALGMMAAIADGGRVSRRLERKLDILLVQGGHDLAAINAQLDRDYPAGGGAGPFGGPYAAALPQIDGTVGAGRPAAAGLPSDDGNRLDPANFADAVPGDRQGDG